MYSVARAVDGSIGDTVELAGTNVPDFPTVGPSIAFEGVSTSADMQGDIRGKFAIKVYRIMLNEL